ncbi:MAG TPA: GNAT family N-acetyltransferase [Candidatus Marinimicrobia bacterium]|nr:GNAT family N-acetyltransferase [Candidatus Neomarinimicrobiota bacterium]MCS5640062.1 GNAT family N-acetyltransferase [Candidatus Neomarinimicrobiota bacterium]PCH60388.1 MAG: GNAT family N-acetyltransferase [Candidatus Neomarinimicrobiota bacterium]HIB14428.1 GNAT family N-acetyltransferase [Candidatus Neomarinimicrobiota bacterium]HIM53191.1 GNAT family N-acetyltransferase [Candidatus Neomarinimicrobiota bacterium]
MKIIEPNSSAEFEQYYNLRYEVLRKPWLQPKGSEKDDGDKSSIHRMIIDESNGKAVAVGRLQFNTSEEAQIRYMAVSDNYQLKGYGNIIVKTLEDIALNKGIRNIILQARENALKFYWKNGYEIIEKSYLLFDEIQHWLMVKKITTD